MSVDAHCHIDLHPDPQRVVDSAVAAGLRVVAVTTTPAAFKGSSRFTDKSRGVLPALGMHPEVVGTRPKDMSLFTKYLDQVTWVGEIGLDGSHRFRGSWDQQVAVFKQILNDCAEAGGRVLSIHSRAASKRVLELLAENPNAGTPVLHWFSGRTTEVDIALDLGAYFSINKQMLQSKSGIAIAQRVPLDRLLTESDAPFAQCEQGKSLIEQIEGCEQKIAEIFGCSQDTIRNAIAGNFDVLSSGTDSSTK
jgi:TatD DNase family protein